MEAHIKFYQTGTFTVGNRLLAEDERTVQADMHRTNSLNSGHRACQGCGEALGARYAIDSAMRATGNKLIAVNATGCLEVFRRRTRKRRGRLPWIHSLFGNAAAVASGVAAAQRALGHKGVRVIAQGGDGGTTDIGFGCLSGMFERNDDVLYVCYDNEAYMNTGVQRSSATPPAARTATTPALGPKPGNVFGTGKNVPLIAMAHNIPYVATASVSNLRDLERKVTYAMGIEGARYIHIFVPCPLGWGVGARGHDQGGAPRGGDRPVSAVRSASRRNNRPHAHPPPVPVTDYLKLQKRFAHLFGKTPDHDRIAMIQKMADHNIAKFGLLALGECVEKPYAITLDAGSSLANKTGAWRTNRPQYVDLLPPCNDACPAGENIQGWLYHAESGDYEAAWRALTQDNPLAAIMGRVCYHPCEGACNRGKLDEAVGINSVERFLGDEAIKRGWQFEAPPPATGKHVLVVGAGPSGLSAAYHLRRFGHHVRIVEAGPFAGGMMRFGIPTYRLPRDVLDAEIKRILDLGIELNEDLGHVRLPVAARAAVVS